jgi:hypothetical protein
LSRGVSRGKKPMEDNPLSEVLRRTLSGFVNVKAYYPESFQKFSGEIRMLTAAIGELCHRVEAFEKENVRAHIEGAFAGIVPLGK